MEIRNFHKLVYQENEIAFPEAPPYWKDIKNFRDSIPAHADKEKKFKTFQDILNVTEPLDKIGLVNHHARNPWLSSQ